MISGATVVNRLISIMPGQESVTLGIRGANEAAYTSETWDHCRRTPSQKDLSIQMMVSFGEQSIDFELYKTTESATPKIGDRITDAESVVWQIKHIAVKMQQKVFRCTCIRNKT